MKFPFVAVCLLMSMAWTTGRQLAPNAPISVTKDNVFKFYKDFKRLTKEPQHVDPEMTDLCRPVYPPDFYEKSKFRSGPHYRALVHYHANSTATAALAKALKILPEGSVLLKEKLIGNWDDITKAPAVNGIGGMIKRAAGFDPEHGDWEYFYADKTTPFTMGKLKNCAECHGKAKDDDHLFRVRDLTE